LLGGTDPAAHGARDRTVIRGEVVKASLSGKLPPLDYYLFVPVDASRDAPLLVTIHGISRNAREHAESFAPFAARHGFAVVAPLFDEDGYDDYQRLGRRGRGPRADAALEHLIDDLERRRVASREVFLFGYSGGGQFVHRYVMAHPERVRAAIVASAGWYTFPDPSVDYPYGIRLDADLPGVRLLPEAFLRVPMLVVVGDDDRERDESLRQSSALDRQQGRTRVERAKRWVRAMRTEAEERGMRPRVELALLEGAGHSFEESMQAGLGELVADYLIRWRSPLGRSGTAQRRAPGPDASRSRWCAVDAR
jgi:poly(3-hydroxybutyrate) depolymerase